MDKTNERILSIDILRGLTIIFMIIVNDPGSWSHVYAPLLHAEWNGITPTDYIFPNFLFIVGVSIVFSIKKQIENGSSKIKIIKKVFWRSIKIYLVGLFLWIFPSFDFDNIRWAGVLQRISLVFLFCAIIYLLANLKQQIFIAIFILILYTLIMVYTPIPGIGDPDLSVPEKNWAHYIDSLYLPGVLWEDTWDPEGILSTFPSIVTGIFGMIAGFILSSKVNLEKKIIKIFIFGFILLFLGDISRFIFPLNKHIWSTSYTFLMGGISSILICLFIFLVDLKNIKKVFRPAKVFGVNSIFSYSLASLFTIFFYSDYIWGFGLNSTFMSFSESIGIPLKLASLVYAIFYAAVIWIPTNILYRKKIYIKL